MGGQYRGAARVTEAGVGEHGWASLILTLRPRLPDQSQGNGELDLRHQSHPGISVGQPRRPHLLAGHPVLAVNENLQESEV